MDFSSTGRSAGRVSVVELVLATIASAEGVDRAELSPPLCEVIDPDALDELVQSTDAPVTVTFTYGDWVVEVQGGAESDVTIEPDAE